MAKDYPRLARIPEIKMPFAPVASGQIVCPNSVPITTQIVHIATTFGTYVATVRHTGRTSSNEFHVSSIRKIST